MTYGIKISKPGKDVKTCDIKDQIFNSEANSLKVWKKGSANISVSEYTGFSGTGEGTATVAHNLSYAPFYLCYFKIKHTTKYWMQDSLDDSVLFGNYIRGKAWTDTTNLYMKVWVNGNNLAAFTAVGYYYILIDKAYE